MKENTRRAWAYAGPVFTGVAMAALPKCPACAVAYLGFFSALGIDQIAPSFMWPLTYALFALSLLFLGFRAWRDSSFLAFGLALSGALTLAFGRALDLGPAMLWTGCALFALGVLLSALRPSAAHAAPCHSAEGVPS